jgi:hypothetical protein
MSNESCKSKKIIEKIVTEEKERQDAMKNLTQELREVETQGELRDIKRQSEIIDELNILDPPENEVEYEKFMRTSLKLRKKRKWIPIKVSAACIAVLISIQLITVTATGFDFFNWTQDMFFTFLGIESEYNNLSVTSSNIKEYKTIEEFEKAENIRILIPLWLPENIEVENIIYSYDYVTKRVELNYNDGLTLLTIELDKMIPDTDGVEFYESNNNIYYIFKDLNIVWWEHNKNYYSLVCGFDVGEHIDKIIINIK